MRARTTDRCRETSALTVLVGTRPVLERGWLQHVDRVVRTADGRLRPRGDGVVVGACLVGAVVEAARRQDDDPCASGPALDALWLALHEGVPDAGADPVGRVPSPVVRDLRARDLARWNDAPERTRDDVLALVDRATSRLSARQPAVDAEVVSGREVPRAAAGARAPGWLRARGAAAAPAGRPR